jgi:aspartate racemase
MKTIGLIGGASPISTAEYYNIINQEINKRMGSHHSAKINMVSVDFNEAVVAWQNGNWQKIKALMVNAAKTLEDSRADFIVICCNTLHRVAPDIESVVNIPLLHILNPVARDIKKLKLNKVGLLGSTYTMNGDYHRSYLLNNFKIETIIPTVEEMVCVNDIIFNELCYGIIRPSSKAKLLTIVNSLALQGAEGIILGCTELPLILPLTELFTIPILHTTAIHARAAVDYALAESKALSFSLSTGCFELVMR